MFSAGLVLFKVPLPHGTARVGTQGSQRALRAVSLMGESGTFSLVPVRSASQGGCLVSYQAEPLK